MESITQLRTAITGIAETAKSECEFQVNKANRLKRIQNELEAYEYLRKKYEIIPSLPENAEDLVALDQFLFLDRFDQRYDLDIQQVLQRYRSQINTIASEKLKEEQANLVKTRYANDVKTYLTDIGNTEALKAFNEADSVVRLGKMPDDSVQS